ncbi:uncharacterized protein EDB91DRAFT_1217491 [Suillus paluster]|uniref:uncharacterized protein n=1 Tax=Suillus paluster TaxID=48578 RepID=UPI001B87DB73|nr:uncharacterized protein EDB91DRAFT_1217491 [Suillus paluster]KAG1749682.1 hypothetical protein EDB91DRAFT_1217491 [Suillus paluster]
MRLHTGSRALGLLLLVQSVEKVAGHNWTQCLVDIAANANATHDLIGLLDGNGDPVSNTFDATAISYSLCTSFCGSKRGIYLDILSQDFSSWLLPYLALISQLPFGAQYRLDNLMSAVLTVGSPALAGYSLFITLLNSRWINRRFSQSVHYPNSRFAVSIISSLQQVPLRLHSDRTRFPSLVVLPENDTWWKYFSELVDYTHTWSIASATSIAWVVIAYILSIVNTPSDAYANSQAGSEATSSMWLWLIPIVIGWLQLSPKCDFHRLQAAYDRADQHARTGWADAHAGTPPASTQRALTITAKEDDVMSPDELLTPPVFNYSRSLRWASTAETMFLAFKVASEKAESHIPVHSESEWVESHNIKTIHPSNRRGSPQEITAYCAPPDGAWRSHWAPGVFTRMALASCASLTLQWGTVGAAFMVEWFIPTTGIGCDSLGYLLYGVVSTFIWIMLLMSSILAHYSAAYYCRPPLSARVALVLSHWLRRMGKLLAVANSIWVVLTCILQYSGFYDTCFCNSSMISRGKATAYVTIIETTAQAALAKAAWIGGLVLTCSSASVFVGLVSLLLDTLP